jgi:uncharacterized protein
VHHILFYEYVKDIVERRAPHREAHLRHIATGKDTGEIVMAGALGDPPHGAAIVFGDVDADAIDAFAREDPYVQAGLVHSRRIELWNVV